MKSFVKLTPEFAYGPNSVRISPSYLSNSAWLIRKTSMHNAMLLRDADTARQAFPDINFISETDAFADPVVALSTGRTVEFRRTPILAEVETWRSSKSHHEDSVLFETGDGKARLWLQRRYVRGLGLESCFAPADGNGPVSDQPGDGWTVILMCLREPEHALRWLTPLIESDAKFSANRIREEEP